MRTQNGIENVPQKCATSFVSTSVAVKIQKKARGFFSPSVWWVSDKKAKHKWIFGNNSAKAHLFYLNCHCFFFCFFVCAVRKFISFSPAIAWTWRWSSFYLLFFHRCSSIHMVNSGYIKYVCMAMCTANNDAV